MQYEIFTVPVWDGGEALERMNKFLRGHKVVQVEKRLIESEDCACWTFCVEYIFTSAENQCLSMGGEKRTKIDYKNILDEEHFLIFSQLRSLRKQIAENDAVPAYAVFTDAELSVLAQAENIDEQTVLSVDGIGRKRLEKYGTILVKMYRENIESLKPSQLDK